MSSQVGAKQPSHVTVATASLIGTAIGWYDFFLYGTAAALQHGLNAAAAISAAFCEE